MAEAATFVPPPLARRALVPTARLLLLVNSLLLALAAWLLLPVDVATPTLAHAGYTAWTVLVLTAFSALPLGGWKAACLAIPWRADGSLVWAWGWLGVYAVYGAFCAASVAQLV
jgi:hypothetical protein